MIAATWSGWFWIYHGFNDLLQFFGTAGLVPHSVHKVGIESVNIVFGVFGKMYNQHLEIWFFILEMILAIYSFGVRKKNKLRLLSFEEAVVG